MDTSQAPLLVTKPPRKRKAATPRAPRVIDPGIAAIHTAAKAEVLNYRRKQASARLLATIITKRLAQLTTEDRNKLADALCDSTTPTLTPTQP